MSCFRLVAVAALAVLALSPALAAGPTWIDAGHSVAVDSSRGVDDLVDYAALVRLGPWDDRNYGLTQGDLSWLAPNEADVRAPLPAFFRVKLRRSIADLARNPAARYPLSALNVFRQTFGGYLVDGSYHRAAFRDGARYWVDLDSPAPGQGATAGIDAATGEVRVTQPHGAAESAVAINPANTAQLVAGSNGPQGGQRMHYSHDAGASWTQVELPLGGTCCDPTVEWSSDGSHAYTATLGCFIIFCDLWFYRSDDGGVTWNGLENVTPGNPRRIVADGADREFMHVDKHPGSPFVDNIYLTYHNGNVMRLARSTDLGNTWTEKVFSSAGDDRGIAGDIATDRAGKIYYAWPSFNSRTVRLMTSTDGGVNFSGSSVVASTNAAFSYPIPGMDAREVAVYISAAADLSNGPFADSVYLAWQDTTAPETGDPQLNHSHVQVAYSRDGGASWTITTPHETADEASVDRWQSFIAVGPDGTVHVIYNDTRRSADRTGADLFYSFSTDGAQTWSTPRRVTSEMSPNINDGFEYGDYSGLDMVMNDLVAIFTDNRSEDGSPGDSVDVYIAGIEPGTSGGAAPGRIPGDPGVSGTPLQVVKSGASDLELSWSAVCGAGNDYAVYEGELGLPDSAAQRQCSTGGATSTILAPSAGGRFYLVVATDGSAEGSYGQTSAGAERPAAAAPCQAQQIGSCP